MWVTRVTAVGGDRRTQERRCNGRGNLTPTRSVPATTLDFDCAEADEDHVATAFDSAGSGPTSLPRTE